MPAPSVTVQVTTVSPSGNVEGALLVTLATEQLSPVVGVPRATPEAVHWPRSAPMETLAGHVMVGGVLSPTVTICWQVVLQPVLVSVIRTEIVKAPTPVEFTLTDELVALPLIVPFPKMDQA